jgi:hypothetical protein
VDGFAEYQRDAGAFSGQAFYVLEPVPQAAIEIRPDLAVADVQVVLGDI